METGCETDHVPVSFVSCIKSGSSQRNSHVIPLQLTNWKLPVSLYVGRAEFWTIVLYIRIFPNMGDKTHPFTIHDARN